MNKKMKMIKCRLCERLFREEDMSDEHYPARSVGNNDVVQLDLVKMMDSLMGMDRDFNQFVAERKKKGFSVEESQDAFFDEYLARPLYPKGRTARTLCVACNRFLGKYDEAYKKFFEANGNPKIVKGFQQKTKLQIIKAIYAKFLSVPEAINEEFDFLDFIRNPDASDYHGKWGLFFVKRDWSTDIMGLRDISTGKMDWEGNGEKIVYELTDDKFIFDLLSFEKHQEFEMNNVFEILGAYMLSEGCKEQSGGYHGQMVLRRLLRSIK